MTLTRTQSILLRRANVALVCLLAFAYPWAGLAIAALALGMWGRRATRVAALLLALSALSPLLRLALRVLA
jgi:hypothetical protein